VILYFFMDRHFNGMVEQNITTRAAHIVASMGGEGSPSERVLPPLDAFETPGVFVQVVSPDGAVLKSSANLEGKRLPWDKVALARASAGLPVTYDGELEGDHLRVHVLPLVTQGEVIAFVQVAMSMRQFEEALARLRFILSVGGLGSLLLAGVVGWAIARRALKPISDITETARAIALSQGFSRRLSYLDRQDEVGLLVITFNEMLASLEAAYAAQRRFVADASHELRAPLTTIRGNLDLLKRVKEMSVEEREHAVEEARREAERLSRLISDLLSIAQADAGQKPVMEQVELDVVVMDVYRQALSMSPHADVSVENLEPITVAGDPDRLRQLLLIFVDNSLRYTPADGKILLSLRREGPWASISVRDTGIGIEEEDLPHIFDRFYRADKARARDPDGSGLGLSIAKWIVEEHGGEIGVESTPGQGSTFTARLPLAES
jgi:signal transduction histidine kinase